MSVIQSILLGILQGVAEFLPISSSGHLKIAQSLFGVEDIPLLYDIFLHLATLIAVIIYFWPKIWSLLCCFGRWISRKPASTELSSNEADLFCANDVIGRKNIIAIILSTIVTGAIGLITNTIIPDLSVKFICAGFLVTSALLIFSSIKEKKMNKKALENGNSNTEQKAISPLQALFIGLLQGVGTLPGVSRSGSTIAGALFCGIDKKSAGNYSFIISIPAILAAFLLDVKDIGEVSSSIGFIPLISGCAAAFVTGYIALAFLMKLINKGKLAWFAAYLIPVGILGMIFLK